MGRGEETERNGIGRRAINKSAARSFCYSPVCKVQQIYPTGTGRDSSPPWRELRFVGLAVSCELRL